MTIDTDEEVHVACAGDEISARPDQDPVIAKARRLQALMRKRTILFPEPIMTDSAMVAMLFMFLAECEDGRVTGAVLAKECRLCATQAEEVLASLTRAGLVRVGPLDSGAAAGGRAHTDAAHVEAELGLTPMGSARMRSYLADHPAV